MYQSFTIRFLAILVLTVLIADVQPRKGFAQDWHIGNPPVQNPVPQYQPIYPLNDVPGSANDPPMQSGSKTPTSTPLDIATAPIAAPLPAQARDFEGAVVDDGSWAEPAGQPPRIPRLTPQPKEPKQDSTNSWDVDYSIHRNRETFPVDPRQRCNICTHPAAVQPRTNLNLPGLQGRPYQEREPGGCQCGKKGCPKCNQVSVNWPAPLSAIRDRHHLSSAELRDQPCPPKRFVDVFDRFANVNLVPYQRRDNGYCGRGSDPYGCLGESRMAGRTTGVEYRLPGTPAAIPVPPIGRRE